MENSNEKLIGNREELNDNLKTKDGQGNKKHSNEIDSPESMSTVSCFSSSSSSNCSTLPPQEQFKPRFSVKLLGNSVSKDGGVVMYTIETRWLFSGENNKQEAAVHRQYEDFEYLHHCLVTAAYPGHGLIIPPLPEEPPARPLMAEEKSREKLGPDTMTLISDEWHKDCWHLQQYLKMMLNHPVFGKHDIWERFLTAKDPPARVKIKKGFRLISKISDSLEHRGKASHRDCDDFFQRERDWVNSYSALIKDCSNAFNATLAARLKLCGVLAHLSTALNLNLVDNESSISRKGIKFSHMFSVAIENYKKGLELMIYNDEASLGSCLELWSRYIDAEKEMLLTRTFLMVDYEAANRSLDKAKANSKEKAHQNKVEVERVFEECSDAARTEIKRFHLDRSRNLAEGVEKYSQAQLLLNQDIYKLLQSSVQNLKKFQI